MPILWKWKLPNSSDEGDAMGSDNVGSVVLIRDDGSHVLDTHDFCSAYLNYGLEGSCCAGQDWRQSQVQKFPKRSV